MNVDLFAGIGGWDLAAESLGIELTGYDWWTPVLRSRAELGWPTVAADLASTAPVACTGLTASPPCQTFTVAATGSQWEGQRAVDWLIDQAWEMSIDHEHEVILNGNSELVLEPLRWTLVGRPRWVAWEQVPRVMPLWRETARVLELEGYSAWAGVLNAEEYGVPQARQRAVLLASRDREVGRPTPTHAAWDRRAKAPATDQLPPPLSMAAGLGRTDLPRWAHTRPAPTITGTHQPHIISPPRWRWVGQTRLSADNLADSAVIELSEALVLQGFPADYAVVGSRADQWRQVANAIPVPLARACLDVLRES